MSAQTSFTTRICKKTLLFTFFFFLSFVSCTRQQIQNCPELDGLSYSHSLETKYATAFHADFYDDSVILLTILETDRYLLVPQNHLVPENLPSDIKLINYPVQNVYLAATSALSLFVRLDSLGSIKFSSIQKKDWYIDEAVQAMENNRIHYAGKYSAPDFELLLDKKCPLALESTMIYHTPAILEKLESLGITVFIDKSSYEENPLGRLEWIKVYGLLTGKLSEAEHFFDAQTSRENLSFSGMTRESIPKIVAFFYVTPSGMVVIRGTDDYIVKMIEMAGGVYAFSSTKKSKKPSIQISMEQFYAEACKADILIYNSSIDNTIRSKQDLIKKNPLFAQFKAVQDDEIWATGSYIYQATDKIGEVILDLQKIIEGQGGEVKFLRHAD